MIRDVLGYKFQTFHAGDYGIEIETESKHAYEVPQGFFWDIPRYEAGHPQQGQPKPEQSLRDFGIEYILKVPVSYEQVPEALSEFREMTKDKKLIPDSISTSVHVHKNILNETFQTMGNYLTLYTLVENILMEYAGEFRKHNLFCLPICDTPSTHENIKDMFLGAKKYQYNSWFLDMQNVKYGALNLSAIGHYGSVEMRQLSGDPSTVRIQQWIDILQSMVVFSRQDITPEDILDFYKMKGAEFLYDVFGKNGLFLKIHAHNELIVKKRNLWYAGQIAYCLTKDEWKSLDNPRDQKLPSLEELDVIAFQCFNRAFHELNEAKQVYVLQYIENIKNNGQKIHVQKQPVMKKINYGVIGQPAPVQPVNAQQAKVVLEAMYGQLVADPIQPAPMNLEWKMMANPFDNPAPKKKLPLKKKNVEFLEVYDEAPIEHPWNVPDEEF